MLGLVFPSAYLGKCLLSHALHSTTQWHHSLMMSKPNTCRCLPTFDLLLFICGVSWLNEHAIVSLNQTMRRCFLLSMRKHRCPIDPLLTHWWNTQPLGSSQIFLVLVPNLSSNSKHFPITQWYCFLVNNVLCFPLRIVRLLPISSDLQIITDTK